MGKYKDYLEFLETTVASANLKTKDPAKWEERGVGEKEVNTGSSLHPVSIRKCGNRGLWG